MFKDWVMHNSNDFTDVVKRKDMKAIYFQVTNLNRNLTKFRPSEIQYQSSPTAWKGSLDMQQPEMSRTNHK